MKTRTTLNRYSAAAATRRGQRPLAQLIKSHKKILGVTYRDIATASGLSVGTLWELVHSAQVRPTLGTVHRVAYVLCISMSEIAPPL